VSQKKSQNCFRHNFVNFFTKFDNFWQKDGQNDKIMQGALTFHFI